MDKKEEESINIYVDGVFDLLHKGHINMFNNTKIHTEKEFLNKNINIIVGLVTDKDAESYKRTPILTYQERKDMLLACKYIHTVVESPPLYLSEEFIENHNIHLVFHGNDNLFEEYYKVAIQKGIMRYIPYTQGVSTTDIICRIIERETTYSTT